MSQETCAHPTADDLLVIRGGAIITGDPALPVTTALGAVGGRVVARGAAAEALVKSCPRGQVFELAGGCAVPGLVDAHAHLGGLGLSLAQVDLRGARSIEEVVARVRNGAPPEGWIVGRGWDQNLWPGAAMPSHEPLTAAFPDRPVWLRRVDGHAGWANAAALQAAKITATTPAPTGGEILLHDGQPSGVLVDAAMALMPTPTPSPAELRRRLLVAQDHALARGLTGVHEMGVSQEADAALRALAAEGLLKLRIVGYADEGWFTGASGPGVPDMPDRPAPDDRYALQGVKIYVDGALGSRGAALLQPYSDRPEHQGMLQHGPGGLQAVVTLALQRGYQVAAHAIGDAAIRAVLDALEAAPRRPDDHRLRVEHAQIVALADIPRFARLGAIASMQPTHASSDMAWVEPRIGPERLAGAYAWQRLLAAGVPLAFGSDFPVEEVEPTFGLYSAITRQDPAGQPPGGWLPDQRLDFAQALAAFTSGAAHAAHRERWSGSLAPNMLADLTCFAADLRTLAPAELRVAEVRATIIGGAIAYRRDP